LFESLLATITRRAPNMLRAGAGVNMIDAGPCPAV
jgi:hypothetical protein